jgi:transposase-like protein
MGWLKWGMKDSISSLRRRPHSTPEQRAKWVRRYERSGLSQREFAERHRLGLSTLRKWIAQDGRQALSGRKGKAVWQELKLDGLAGAARWAAEVVRPDGLVVRVAHDAPPAWLEELLRSRPC